MPAGHDISSGTAEPLPVLYITDDDESIRGDGQVIVEDVYELSAPYVLELVSGALLSLQTDLGGSNFITGSDASGAFLEIRP